MLITSIGRPEEQPITLSDARIQCMMDGDINDEDPLLESLIIAATDYCENYIGFPLIAQKKRYLGYFCKEIKLLSNVISIDRFLYFDTAGQEQELQSSAYYINRAHVVNGVVSVDAWPVASSSRPHPVTIEFTAGFESADHVPESIKQAIRLLVGHWFRYRDAGDDAASNFKAAAHALLNAHRVEVV